MNILVVSPHQDDEVMGCGGTIIKHYKRGDSVYVVYITAGWSGIPEIKSKKKAIKIREKEAKDASKILGIKKTIFLKQEDRNISVNRRLIQKLIKIIRDLKPEIIYTPHSEEQDYEHRIIYQITKEASWLSRTPYLPQLGKAVNSLKFIYLYEVWTPLKKFFLKSDVTNVFNIKIKALSAYKSQIKHLNLVDAIIGLNMYRGSMTNKTRRFTEVFQVEKP